MCDTIVAPARSTAERVTLFGKNSDRQRNEAQAVECFARCDYKPNTEVSCTYLAIPQARHSHAVLLCRPFWSWGAEMGANEHGLVIGNEAVHARIPATERSELPGMDLVRLALERAETAAEALEVITALLEKYGQGGNCGHLTPNYYNNGFLIADKSDVFVLETIGREWLVERVRGVRAISNVYSIGQHPERVSGGLPRLIRDRGWSGDAAPNYANALADPAREHIGHARARRARSTSLLQARDGQIVVADMLRVLRDHGPPEGDQHDWAPERAKRITLCMHAGAADRPGQTTGSLVSELNKSDALHWVTGTAAPCISIFKPVVIGVPLPPHGARPSDCFDRHALWWWHETLHRGALVTGLPELLEEIRGERDAIERDFRTRVTEVLKGGSAADRSQVLAACWNEAHETEERWLARTKKGHQSRSETYRAAWAEMNQIAGIEPV